MNSTHKLARIFAADLDAQPIHLVDVGAAEGLPAHWQSLERHARVTAFEPDRRSFEKLPKSERITWINSALGAVSETRSLYLTRKPTCSSFFPPNRALLDSFPEAERFDVVSTCDVHLDPLDSVLASAGGKGADFIKIDVQGFELEILQGAAKTLEGVIGLELEVEFLPLYEGQPLFRDIDKALSDAGFRLFDLRPIYWKRSEGAAGRQDKGMMAFGDGLYFRPAEDLVRAGDEASVARGKVIRAACLYTLYGYLDWARAAFDRHAALFTAQELALVAETLMPTSRGFWQKVAGRLGLHDLLCRVADLVDPTYHNPFKVMPTVGSRSRNRGA